MSLCCFFLRHTPHASHPLSSPALSIWGLSTAFRSHRGCRGRAPSLTAVPAAPQPVPPHNRRSREGNLHPLSSHAVFTLTREQPKPSQNTHGAVSTRPSRTEERVRDSPIRPALPGAVPQPYLPPRAAQSAYPGVPRARPPPRLLAAAAAPGGNRSAEWPGALSVNAASQNTPGSCHNTAVPRRHFLRAARSRARRAHGPAAPALGAAALPVPAAPGGCGAPRGHAQQQQQRRRSGMAPPGKVGAPAAVP